MEDEFASKAGGVNGLPSPSKSPVIAVAITGNKKSKYVIKWALDNFDSQEDVSFKLLHVSPAITSVPTPMGNLIPVTQVREDVASAFRKEVEWQTSEKLLPYKMMFIRRKVQVEVMQIEADDVAEAIAEEVAKCNITRLVIGVSSVGMFSRGQNWSSRIAECVPNGCTVYAVSKGKLSSVRPADLETNENITDDTSDTSSMSTTSNSSGASSRLLTERTDQVSTDSHSPIQPPFEPMRRFQALSTINENFQSLLNKRPNPNETFDPKSSSLNGEETQDDHTSFSRSSNASDTNSRVSCSSFPPSSPAISSMQQFLTHLNKNQTYIQESENLIETIYSKNMSHHNNEEEDDTSTLISNSKTKHTNSQAVSSVNQTLVHKNSNSGGTHHPKNLSVDHRGNNETIHYPRISDVDTGKDQASSMKQQFKSFTTEDSILLRKNTTSNEFIEYIRPIYLSSDAGQRDRDTNSSLNNSDIKKEYSVNSCFRSLEMENCSRTTDQAPTSDAAIDFSSGCQANINFELERLKMELQHIQGKYIAAKSDAIYASKKLSDLQKCLLEANKVEEMSHKEEKTKDLAEQENEKYESLETEVDYAKEYAQGEAEIKRAAQAKTLCETNEKEKLLNALGTPVQQYQIFTWEEIVSATEALSEKLKVGMGSYGTVYKCILRHTTAAVKILHSKAANRNRQFQLELEILSKIRHPNLLTLLGACPDHGCLIYEYMENGSLEERLLRKGGTPPLQWFERFRIAQGVAIALVFLHNSKPKPIIHRDLKPANILLDHNLVSKIGDVGLSTMLQIDSATASTMYKDTSPVGTLCYIDPEYQRTGLVSPKSDIYAFGMVILQLLTAKPAIALAHKVEEAIEDDTLMEILDPEAGDWPFEETKELAGLALRCTEFRRRDRPDLKDEILPALEKLKRIADEARELAIRGPALPPNHFICPILKDIMIDPCVAADGYTYDHKAMEAWLEENDVSPVTKLPLQHKVLLPNYTLLSAIMEWKQWKSAAKR